MYSPDWIDRALDWEQPLPWYKTIYIRMIINPADTFFTWWYWKVSNRWVDLKNAYMRIKYGIDYTDIWNMNSWFIDGAIQILETWLGTEGCPIGHPVMMLDDGDESHEMTYDKWIEILNEMLEGFKLYKCYEGSTHDWPTLDAPPSDIVGEIHNGVCHEILDKTKSSQSCYGKDGAHYMTFEGVWTKCSMTKFEEEKFQRALGLFTKYFYSLWD